MTQIDQHLVTLDQAMKKLREAMSAPVLRVSGLKGQHDTVARSLAKVVTVSEAAKPLFTSGDKNTPRARRR